MVLTISGPENICNKERNSRLFTFNIRSIPVYSHLRHYRHYSVRFEKVVHNRWFMSCVKICQRYGEISLFEIHPEDRYSIFPLPEKQQSETNYHSKINPRQNYLGLQSQYLKRKN
jgi:hypothetical protein